jgi:uncharacterized protein YnzC (UPF0291/DUF896 family)
MSKLIEELLFKFNNIVTKIENKINYLNKSHKDQEIVLNEKFNTESLVEKYSNVLNNQRKNLLNQISNYLNSEISHVNELAAKTEKLEALLDDFKKTKKLQFNCSVFKSTKTSIRRLLINEFKFGSLFSSPQLVKYQNILELNGILIPENSNVNLHKSFLFSIEKSNLETVRLLLESGIDVDVKN